jgi:exopolysaccharide biosynthesis polyprenyl glycosylphosphotransferase
VWSRISALVSELHELPVRVWVAPDYYTLALHRARVEELAGIPLIDLRAPALNEYQRLTKRIFDLSLTLLIMPFVLPLMGLIAIAIRLDSPGPIIFSQTRVGENGKLFKMFKFRSMVKDADKMRHVIEQVDENGRIIQDKRKHDPRVTRVGRFLRRTSLDELPQLFNVLKGEMSLVGPRPEMPHLVAQYELWQRKRFAVPQGITGWWQVNGRSDKPMHQHTEDDLYYVQNYSLWLDVVILFKTLVAVVRRKGAY